MKVAELRLFNNKYSILLIYTIVTSILYYKAFYVGLLSDDYSFFLGVEMNSWSSILNNFNDSFVLILTHIFQLLIYKSVGISLFTFHAIQILLHILIAWNIFLLLKLINLKYSNKTNLYFAFFSGLFFLIIPYQTESVIWLASIGYGFSLLFGVIAIRCYYSNLYILSYISILCSIFCKEMGYTIPLAIIVIDWYLYNLKSNRKHIIYLLLVIIFSLIIRYIFLIDFVGGYGRNVHLNLSFIYNLEHFLAYIYKYSTYSRFFEYSIISSFLFCFSMLLCVKFFIALYEDILNFRILLLCLFLFIISLLPVLNLEITSIYNISSDRYSYFCSVIVSISISYIISLWKFKMRSIFIVSVVIFFISLTFIDVKKWGLGTELCNNYLSELEKLDLDNKKVLLLNVPDNIQGVYVLRNGVDEYLKMKNITCNLDIFIHQQFITLNSGLYVIKDSLISNNASNLYIDYNNDLYGIDNFNIKDKDLLYFDMVYYYNNKKFYKYYD